MIGSCLMTALKGPQLLKKEIDFIRKNQIAGIILFQRNIESFRQLSQLNAEIKSLTQPPPLIAIDMEGGAVNRFSHLKEAGDWPSAESLSMLSPQNIFLTAKEQARRLKRLGIDLNFAPVVDLPLVQSSVLQTRTFGKSAEAVLNSAEPFLKGFENQALISCLKHFPGHGGVSEDSHKTLPRDTRNLKELQAQLRLFQKLFRNRSCCIMTAHVEFSNIEKGPATFSKTFLTLLLRKKWGFKGLIVSDDIDMKALNKFSPAESFFSALKAGCNLVLACQKRDSPFEIIDFFESQAQRKASLKAELRHSSQKLLQLKKDLKKQNKAV